MKTLLNKIKEYNFDTLDYGKASTKLNKIDEYIYRGKKYVRVKANSCYFRDAFILSNVPFFL